MPASAVQITMGKVEAVLIFTFLIWTSECKHRANTAVHVARVSNRVTDATPPISFYSLNPSFKKPTFMRHVASQWHIPGTDVVLPCMAVGVRPITYYWEWNGEPLTKRHRVKFATKKSMLKIKRIRDNDVGRYKCIASNQYGNLSFTFHIKIQDKRKIPEFYDLNMMARKQVTVRPTKENVRFLCRAESKAPVHYLWLKNGVPFHHIKPGKRTIHKKKTRHTDRSDSGDLVLKNLKAKDGGVYTCVAFNRYGNISFAYELRIILRRNGGPPKVLPFTRPNKQIAHAGSNLSFDCLEIMSNTLPDVRWFHMYENQDRNVMPNIPNNVDWENFVPESLPFHADYIPAINYQTFRVRHDTHAPAKRYVHDDTEPYGLRLSLKNVTQADSGIYTCLVSNNEGLDLATFYLRVKGN